ncbi:MAG: HPr family phosphocarrier protein [Candidatus Coatesbacteria bacterium]
MSEQTGTAGVGILEPQAGAARFGPGRAVVLPGGTAVERAAVVNPAWLGIGQAIDFARAAALFPCRILVARGRQVADAKHALDLAALGAAAGARLVLTAHGPRAAEAVCGLSMLIASGYRLDYRLGD